MAGPPDTLAGRQFSGLQASVFEFRKSIPPSKHSSEAVFNIEEIESARETLQIVKITSAGKICQGTLLPGRSIPLGRFCRGDTFAGYNKT